MREVSYVFKFIQPNAECIQKLISEHQTPRDIFYWVRNNIRYVETSTPRLYCQRPCDAIKRDIGNCKDMSFIMQSAFEALGIKSMVRIVHLPFYDKNGHRMYHAYVVVKYGGYEHTLDATNKSTEFGQLPFYGEEIPVLSLTSQKYMVFNEELLNEVNRTFLVCGG